MKLSPKPKQRLISSRIKYSVKLADFPDRFQSKVIIQKNGCWIWSGAKNHAPGYPQYAYGRYTVDGRDPRTGVYAHVFAYELAYGPLLFNELDVDHRCHNKLCVNPKHLQPLTHQDNCRHHKPKKKVAK